MRYREIVLTGVLVGLASLACAQGLRYESFYNWNMLGAGARARGMGGAFLAVSDDGSAGTWNPAGLPYNEGVLTSMNWNYVHAAVDNNPVGFGEASGNFGSIGFWSFVAPVTLRGHEFVGAVTYNRLIDIFYEDGIASRPLTTVDSLFFSSQARSVGDLAGINLGFGTSVAPKLTVGAGVNLAAGNRKDNLHHKMIGRPYEYQGVEFTDSTMINLEANIDYSGFFPNFGAMYRTDKWSVGAIYTAPWTLTERFDFGCTHQSVFRNIPSQPLEELFITKRKIEMPYSVGLGGAYRPLEKLLVAFDYQYRNFKGHNISTQQVEEPTSQGDDPKKGVVSPASAFTDFPTKWYNLHQVRLGAEYVLESGYGRIPLRVGVHNVPMVAGNTTGTRNDMIQYFGQPLFDVMTFPGSSSDQNMGFGMAFGAGIHWSQIHLDFAFEFENSSSTDSGEYWISYSENGIPPYQKVKLADYSREYKHKQSRFLLNFTGYF